MPTNSLKALALLSSKRFPATPDIPTAAEQGYSGLEFYVWFGLFAPVRTPQSIITKIPRSLLLRSLPPLTKGGGHEPKAGAGGFFTRSP